MSVFQLLMAFRLKCKVKSAGTSLVVSSLDHLKMFASRVGTRLLQSLTITRTTLFPGSLFSRPPSFRSKSRVRKEERSWDRGCCLIFVSEEKQTCSILWANFMMKKLEASHFQI